MRTKAVAMADTDIIIILYRYYRPLMDFHPFLGYLLLWMLFPISAYCRVHSYPHCTTVFPSNPSALQTTTYDSKFFKLKPA